MLAATFSVEGHSLSEREKTLFQRAKPCGFILFGRNIDTPKQLLRLISDLKACVGWDCPILIDQEGGRVQRLKAPHWTDFPPAAHYKGNQEQLAQDMNILASELVESGFNVNCAPVLDMRGHTTHDSIGDRAYSTQPQDIIACASIVIEGFLSHKITPVIKHLPGQGRAMCDSHKELPCIEDPLSLLSESDFIPCRALSHKYGAQIWGMVAHVLYTDIDTENPATLSRKVLKDIIREEIGFSGFLVSDDISMNALDTFGSIVDRSHLALEAGCDSILYCSGIYEEMTALAQCLPSLSEEALERLEQSNRWTHEKT